MHLKDFADYCMSEEAPAGWFESTERNTLFIKEYIKSNWQKQQYASKTSIKNVGLKFYWCFCYIISERKVSSNELF